MVYLSKLHGVFSVRRLLELNLCHDMLLNSPKISVERYGRRQISHAQSQCSQDRRVGFGRHDLLEFHQFNSSVFDGVFGQETGAQLRFEPVKVVLFGVSTCLVLPPPLKSIVSKNCGSKGDS